MTQPLTGQRRLSLALNMFQGQLTPAKQTALSQTPQPDTTAVETLSAQINNQSNLCRKKLGDKIKPFLVFMRSFDDFIGAHIQCGPRVSALIWGSIKLVIEVISSYDHTRSFINARDRRHPKTGEWLLENPTFTSWNETPNSSVLWYYGIPGSGKSMLITSLIDHTFAKSRHSRTSIAYYFCDFLTPESLKYRTILSSLLKQLAILSQPILTVFQDKLEDAYMDNQLPPDVRQIEELLTMLAQSLGLIYIFLDGVDECATADRIDLLSCFKRLLKANPTSIRIAISSRPDIDIPRTLNIAYEISLKTVTDRPDLEAYIADELETKCENIRAYSQALRKEIEAALLEGADGMFLWVFYQIEDIRKAKNKDKIRELLGRLPRGLHETYERIANKIIHDRDTEEAIRVFQWLSWCRRPLTIAELMDAISIRIKDKQHSVIRGRYSDDPSRIVHNCGNIVILNEADGTVQYAHSTAATYLASCKNLLSNVIDQRSKRDPPFCTIGSSWPRNQMTQGLLSNLFRVDVAELEEMQPSRLCATYLQLNDFQTQIARIGQPSAVEAPGNWLSRIIPPRFRFLSSVLQYAIGSRSAAISVNALSSPDRVIRRTLANAKPVDLYTQYPFLGYTTTHWLDHFNIDHEAEVRRPQYPEEEPLSELFAKLLNLNTPFSYLPNMIRTEKPDAKKLLYWACENDHLLLFQSIQNSLTTLNFTERTMIEGEEFPPPLFCAARSGSHKIVAHVLQYRCRSFYYGHLGHQTFIADISDWYCEFRGDNPLSVASEFGHERVVGMLLEARRFAELDVTGPFEQYTSSLKMSIPKAICNDHLEVVKALVAPLKQLNLEVDPNIDYARYAWLAASNGHLNILGYLCDERLYVQHLRMGTMGAEGGPGQLCNHGSFENDVLKCLVEDGHEDFLSEILTRFEHTEYAVHPAFLQAIEIGNVRVLDIIAKNTSFVDTWKDRNLMGRFSCSCGSRTVRPLVRAVEAQQLPSVKWLLGRENIASIIDRSTFNQALSKARQLSIADIGSAEILCYMLNWANDGRHGLSHRVSFDIIDRDILRSMAIRRGPGIYKR
ncbi:hypothetical protein TWF696_006653 [Orbilia brochopaga]|uniref:NACHT domain-containing protein n=1 Tax=Orbilia brochopaga TaxID=3140254 RepID=A0AAV9UQZ8_9PEZI